MNVSKLTALALGTVALLAACDNKPTAPGTSSTALLSSSIDIAISSSDGVVSSSSSDGTVSSNALSSAVLSSSVIKSSSSVAPSSGIVKSSSSVAPLSSSVLSSAVLSSSVVKSSSSVVKSSSSVTPSSSSVVGSSSSVVWNPYNNSLTYGTMTDPRDGKVYKTIWVNGYTLLAQNLNYGARVNGTLATDNQYNDAVAEKYCYNDLESNCDKYGGLYQWAEAMALPAVCDSTVCASQIATGFHQGLCPTGWHIWKAAEFGSMVSNLAANNEALELKAGANWYNGGIGTNSTGLTILGGGARTATESGGGYLNVTKYAKLWYASEYDYLGGDGVMFTNNSNSVSSLAGTYKSNGYSIRCVQDY